MASCQSILKKLFKDNRITKREYEKLRRNVKNDITEAFITIVWYNGYLPHIKQWSDALGKAIENKEYSLTSPIFGPWPRETDALYTYAQLEVLWMMLVEWYGDYGTSPRSGWIENKEDCKEFLDEVVKTLEEWENGMED